MQSILVNKTLEQIDAAPVVAHVDKAAEASGAVVQRGRIPRAWRAVQRGFTLIEVLIVIALVAVMLGAVFAVANRVNVQSTLSDFSSNMTLMASETRTAFRPQGTFLGVTPAVLIGMGIVPPSMVSGSAIVTPWAGSTVEVAPEMVSVAGDAVRFTVSGIPGAQCAAFVAAMEPAFARIRVGPTNVKNMTAVTFPGTPALAPNTVYQAAPVGTACSGAGPHTALFIMTR